MNKTKILALFANPRGSDPLRLSNEDRVIKECIRRSEYRSNLSLEVRHAATIDDLRRALLEEEYRIVHFSGHGTGIGLAFETETGDMMITPPKALASFLAKYPSIECVILNACYTDSQGELISINIPYTVAIGGAIGDDSATEFSRGFYDAIGAGRSIEFAYQEGCDNIRLKGLSNDDAPIILRKASSKPVVIPISEKQSESTNTIGTKSRSENKWTERLDEMETKIRHIREQK